MSESAFQSDPARPSEPPHAGERAPSSGSSIRRRWRIFRGPPRTATERERSEREAISGRCPGCGGLVRFSPAASPIYRCPHCETPLVADSGALDVEQAVHTRLYQMIASINVARIDPDR
jgi:ribosomal protein L37AE/L43A